MIPDLNKILEWLESEGCGDARFGRDRAIDIAAAIKSLWDKHSRVLLVYGTEQSGARAVAAAAAKTWTDSSVFRLNAEDKTLALTVARVADGDPYRELTSSYHLDGLGQEEPAGDIGAFLDRWLARASQQHASQVMFVWTQLRGSELIARYTPHVVERLMAASAIINLGDAK